MKAMKFIEINNQEELDKLICKLESESWLTGNFEFLKREGLKVCGHFEFKYFVCRLSVKPGCISTDSCQGIFQTLKLYGSSSKYAGVLNSKGETVIPFIYESIYEYWGDLIIVERSKKKGVYHLDGRSVCSVKYDHILPLSEFVFGVCENSKLGFMSLGGEIIVPLEYIYDEMNNNIFKDGCCCVLKELEDKKMKYGFIDHYNNAVIPFKFDSYAESISGIIKDIFLIENRGNDYIRERYNVALDGSIELLDSDYIDNFSYSDYEASLECNRSSSSNDVLDAYEGDINNMWNTD